MKKEKIPRIPSKLRLLSIICNIKYMFNSNNSCFLCYVTNSKVLVKY